MSTSYDLIVIGTGSGNSIPTEQMESWRIAIVEPGTFGGTCLNVGCIPSKMFIHSADVAWTIRDAERFGVHGTFERADWPAIRDRVFGRIDPIAQSGEEYRRSLDNITVYDEPAQFVGPKALRVGSETITAERIVLAAGSRPRVPTVDGIEAVTYHTSDTIMRLDSLPAHLMVIGGGAIASEMTHIFHSLGSDVTMLVRGGCLLGGMEPEVSDALGAQFLHRGVDLRMGTSASAARAAEDGTITLTLEDGGELSGDVLLLAAGRVSNADTLALDAAGIEVDAEGQPIVDDHMRTSVDGIWALGDLIGHHEDLKHIANAHAKAISSSLTGDEAVKPTVPNQPLAIFTDPEVATVGLTEAAAREAGYDIVVGTREYGSTAYGWALEDTSSFGKVVVDANTRLILGATIIGPMASILIQTIVQAMTFGQTADEVATQMVWPHPALTELVENLLLETRET